MFFVVSTGRSGTQTIAKTFSQLPDCVCLHEPAPELILESSGYRCGTVDHGALKLILADTRAPLRDGKIYGESNQTLSLIIPVLAETFPEAKYIWLMRSGLDVVSSIVARKWYTGHTYKHTRYEDCAPIEKLWIDGRIEGDRCGDVPAEQWTRMNSFAKCCWYWSYINRTIEADLLQYAGIGKYTAIRLEDFTTRFVDIASWLGFDKPEAPVVGQHNKASYATYAWQQWSVAERKTFQYWCGPMMDKLYAGWRDRITHHSPPRAAAGEGGTPNRATSRATAAIPLIHETPQSSRKPLVSVFVLSYNQKDTLTDALDSVLQQTLPPHQIIIVDDASTDGSREIISDYRSRHPDLITAILHDHNRGVARCRADALQAVTGDYVTYVDGDDRFLPEKIEKELRMLLSDERAAICFSNNRYVDIQGAPHYTWCENTTPPSGNIFARTFSRDFPRRSLFRMEMVNYQAWKAVGFHDPHLTLYEDFDMRIRLTKHFQALYCDAVLSEIRVHSRGLSKLPQTRHIASLDTILHKNKHLLQDLDQRERALILKSYAQWVRPICDKAETIVHTSRSIPAPPAASASGSYRGENLIFILSQPRGGSTLLQRLLAGNPEIHTTAEPWLMLHPLYALKPDGLTAEYDAHMARNALDDFLQQFPEKEEAYIDAIRNFAATLYGRSLKVSGKSYFLDKTPRYYRIVPDLIRVFPDAKFIFLLRNPAAVLSSTLQTWFGNDIEKLLRSPAYRDLLLSPRPLLSGIRQLHEKAIVVHYEELVAQPQNALRHLCVRLGLTFYDTMLDYGKNPKPSGRYGDPTGIHRHIRPTTASAEKWVEHLADGKRAECALAYLASLGTGTIDAMGYSSRDIVTQLKGNPKGGQSASELNHAGETFFKEGDLNSAIAAFQSALKQDPDCATACSNLGVAYWQAGIPLEAHRHLQDALSIDAGNKIVLMNYIATAQHLGQHKEALAACETFLAGGSSDTEIITHRDRLLKVICSPVSGHAGKSSTPDHGPAEISPAHTSRPILVTGAHRSGSTWVGRVLAAAPDTAYLDEPFNRNHPACSCGATFPYWFQYVCQENEHLFFKHIQHVLSDLTQGDSNLRPVFKDPIAVFSAEWLARRFSMDVVVLIRHPAAFASSLKRLNWGHNFSSFLNQPLLMRDYLHPFENDIRIMASKEHDIIDQAALLWRLIYHVVLRYRSEQPDWMFVRHKDISQNPLNYFQTIFSHCGLHYTDASQELVMESTSSKNPSEAPDNVAHFLKRDSRQIIYNWQKILTKSEIARIRDRVEDISCYFYTDNDWTEFGHTVKHIAL